MFLKRTVPVAICFLAGIVFVLQYFVPHQASQDLLTRVNDWLIIIVGFAILLGIGNLFFHHIQKIAQQRAGWGYSIVLFAAFTAALIAGILSKAKTVDEVTGVQTGFGWIYDFMMVPLGGTMFAMLGFFIASAAFRTFRLRSLEASLLLAAALLLMFGRVPLGEHLWSRVVDSPTLQIGRICEWVMGHLNLAARRGIMLGVALGIIATSLKMIFGVERSYMGGGKE